MPAGAPAPRAAFLCPAGGDRVDLDLNALLSASEVAAWATRPDRTVSVQAVCNWHARGLLPYATNPVTGTEIRDGRGRPKYRLIDAAKAAALAEQRDRRAPTAA